MRTRTALLVSFVTALLGGCVEGSDTEVVEPAPTESALEGEVVVDDALLAEIASNDPEVAKAFLADACFEQPCPPQYSDCRTVHQYDCEGPFCRQTGNQCWETDRYGTFQGVVRVNVCFNPDWPADYCVAYDYGRELIHCGC